LRQAGVLITYLPKLQLPSYATPKLRIWIRQNFSIRPNLDLLKVKHNTKLGTPNPSLSGSGIIFYDLKDGSFLDPDPYVLGLMDPEFICTDPDPPINKQKHLE
jgi:hypothetical protein